MPPQHPASAVDDDMNDASSRRRLRTDHHRPSSSSTSSSLRGDLLSDLLSHNAYFDDVVNMIPAKLYVPNAANNSSLGANGLESADVDNSKYRKGQHVESKEARRGMNKRSKYDPEVVETTLETKRRLKKEEEKADEDDDDDDDDDGVDDDDENDDDGEGGGESASAAMPSIPETTNAESAQYASRIEALRAKLRARLASLATAAGGSTSSSSSRIVVDGSSSSSAPDAAAVVSKRAARRAEKKRRADAAKMRAGRSTGQSSAIDVDDANGKRRRLIGNSYGGSSDVVESRNGTTTSKIAPTTTSVASDLSNIDYQSLSGLRPKHDGAFDNKSLSGMGMGGGGGGGGGVGEGTMGKNGRRKSLEKLLANAEKKRARLKELKSSGDDGDMEKARDIEWGDALRVAG
jgi:hypothetical protein